MRLTLCACLLAAAVAAAALPDSSSAAPAACGKPGYSYAGLQSARSAHGVRATLSAIADPYVQSGHVAAWVGVGGPGAAGNGGDAWLQVGLSGFAGSSSKLYYEVVRPGGKPTYNEIDGHVAPGVRKRVAVLEMGRRPYHWRVWVNGRPVSRPIYLGRNSSRWRPIATAETWDGGQRACNGFGYRFERVKVAMWRGGSWTRFVGGYRFQDRDYRVVRTRKGAFRALATAAPVWNRAWRERVVAVAQAAAAPAATRVAPTAPAPAPVEPPVVTEPVAVAAQPAEAPAPPS